MVVSFDTGAELVADLTDDTDKLAQADSRPAARRRHRALRRDLLRLPRQAAAGPAAAQVPPRHHRSQRRRRQPEPLHRAIRRWRWRRRPTWSFYAISTNIRASRTDGDKVLKYFTRETGGLAFFPFKVQDLAQCFREHRQRVAAPVQPAVSPRAAKTDGLFHQSSIKVKNRKDLVVRARKGYYAPRS